MMPGASWNQVTGSFVDVRARKLKKLLAITLSGASNFIVQGRCIFASGSPFDALKLDPSDVEPNTPLERRPGQANNSYIFPGISLGIVGAKIQPVTEEDFIVAAEVSQSATCARRIQ